MNNLEHLQDLFKNLEPVKQRNANSKVLLVDGLNSYIRTFRNSPAANDNGEHIGGIYGFMMSIAKMIREHKPTRCVLVFDGKGGSKRRKEKLPEYKEGRNPTISGVNRIDDHNLTPEEELLSMKQQFSRLHEYLGTLPVTIIMIDNVEADDIIAYLTTDIFTGEVVIVSDDKDFLQLVNERVHVLRPVEKKYYTKQEVLDRFKVSARNYLMYKVFMGDGSDNIQGIDSIGPKTLLKHFPELISDTELTLDDIINKCNSDPTNKTYQKILAQKDKLFLNHDIMQLHDVDISGSAKLLASDLISKPITTLNKFYFKKMFMEDKAYSTIKNLDNWLDNSFKTLQSYTSVI